MKKQLKSLFKTKPVVVSVQLMLSSFFNFALVTAYHHGEVKVSGAASFTFKVADDVVAFARAFSSTAFKAGYGATPTSKSSLVAIPLYASPVAATSEEIYQAIREIVYANAEFADRMAYLSRAWVNASMTGKGEVDGVMLSEKEIEVLQKAEETVFTARYDEPATP